MTDKKLVDTSSPDNSLSLKEALRVGMRRLASGVSVVSTYADQQRYAMTASSVTSVSDDPASLLVCVNKDASMQSKLPLGQPFVVNVLAHSQQDVSNTCASRETSMERFEIGQWEEDEQALPYLSDALVSFFCVVDNDNYMYGTHQIVIGRIDKVIIANEVVDPLLYVNGSYASVNSS